MRGTGLRRFRPGMSLLLSAWVCVQGARGGGGPENALVVIDPSSPESIYVGHYYIAARGVPAENVLYMPPGASDFTSFLAFQRDALMGMLSNRGIADHIDYIVLTPGGPYSIPAPNLVVDGCSSVTRFSATAVYTFAFIAESIQPGTPVQRGNQYYSTRNAWAFDSGTGWRSGQPSDAPNAERYFIATLLGYTGERGNTVDEILDMIDRSVAADGAFPPGTFYYMRTSDNARSTPRHGLYPSMVTALRDLGANAEMIDCAPGCNDQTVLPVGHHDCLGIMTGWASPDIDGTDFTIMPGAMGDHMTSYAATFGGGGQTKLSRWIAKGASGSFGTVEEPCNYLGKFPHPRFHVHYYEGLTMGEAGLRSLGFLPWQVLAYGDPLTQPFAYLPEVDVPDAPGGEVSGVITLTPRAETQSPFGLIAGFELVVNGALLQRVGRRGFFELDTAILPDGYNDLRVIAFDDSTLRTQDRWTRTLVTNNFGRSADLAVDPPAGDRATVFTLDVSAAGGDVAEIRVEQNGRVLASTTQSAETIKLLGESLGPGPGELVAVALFDDGKSALSGRVSVDVTFSDPPPPQPDVNPPAAFGYTRPVVAGKPMLLELPGADLDDPALSFEIAEAPSQGELSGSGPLRLLKPDPRAEGRDRLAFRVISQGRPSEAAVIDIVYQPAIPCGDVAAFKAKCKRGSIKGQVKLTTADHDGGVVEVAVDGQPSEFVVKGKKAKFVFRDQAPGSHVVTLERPPDCKPARNVVCD